jgi:hypothetical protein
MYIATTFEFDVTVKVDTEVFPKWAKEMIEFYGDQPKKRFMNRYNNNVIHAALSLVHNKALWLSLEHGVERVDELVSLFKGEEGYPPMDGSYGIQIVDFKPIAFDDDPDVRLIDSEGEAK